MPENLPLRLIQTDEDFNAEALALFYWQLEHVEVYKRFFEYAGRSAEKILTWSNCTTSRFWRDFVAYMVIRMTIAY
ncbi:MAG: hypothetical protein LW707_05400 [Sphingobacteriales bacterium]|nr:hypothetical protein [Sphingobacteriales bacterium]